MQKRTSLKRKTILSTIGIVAATGIIAAGIIFVVTKQNFDILKKNNSKSMAVAQAHEIGQRFAYPRQLIAVSAKEQMLVDYLEKNSQPQDPYVLEMLHHYNIGNTYDYLSILNATGTVLISTEVSLVGSSASPLDYFKQSIKGEPSIESIADMATKSHGYYFSQPILAQDESVVGVLVGAIDGKRIDELLQGSMLAKNGNVMFVDTDGMVLYSNVPARVHASIGPLSAEKKNEIIDSQRFGGMPIFELQYSQIVDVIRTYIDPIVLDFYDSVDKKNEIVAVARIPDAPFFLISEENNSLFMGPALIISIVLSIAALFSAILVGLFIYIFSIRFLRPLKRVKDAAERVSGGDYTYHLDLITGDEFEDVANAFNGMVTQLQSVRANLEQVVLQKTATLSGQLQEVEKKNSALQDMQRAVLNVLEDARALELQLQDERDRLKGILASMGEGLFVFDKDFRIIVANETTVRILGIPLSSIEGAVITKLITLYRGNAVVSDNERPIFKIVSAGAAVHIDVKDDMYWSIKGGKKFAVGFAGAPISVGGLVGGVIIFRDLTLEKNLDDARTSFISITSHQLRTPLTSLKWFLEMLMDGSYAEPLTTEQKKFADLAYQASERMMGIINLLLQIARVEAGRVKIVPVSMDLRQFTQDIVTSFGNVFDAKKQTVAITTIPDPLPSIFIDKDILGQVMQNLLSNANRYALESTTIVVTFKAEGDVVTVSIADRGIGISKADTQRIFEKFYRAENALRLVPEGSGLGLSLVKSLVEGWGGKIWFESEEWKGTTFFFTIPLAGMTAREGEVGIHVA